MNLAAVMDELAAELDTISGLRVYAYPPDNVAVPAAVIGYPEEITYDVSMGRGTDHMVIPIFLLVGRLTDRTARDHLAPFMAGSGASSIKGVLRAATPFVAMSSVRVASATVEVVTMANVEYLTAVFTVDVYGQGA